MTPALQASCLDALSDAASELAATVLGGLTFAVLEAAEEVGGERGAYLGLSADDEPIQVGILVNPEGCQMLAKALLGMESGDEDLPPPDVSDAMCEIINIVAGGLKRRVSGQIPVTMGLPIFVSGHPLPNQQQQVMTRAVQIGDVAANVILLTQKRHVSVVSRGGTLQTAGEMLAKEQSA